MYSLGGQPPNSLGLLTMIAEGSLASFLHITSVFIVLAGKDFLHIRRKDGINSIAGHIASLNKNLVCQIVAINDNLLITAQLNLIDLSSRNKSNRLLPCF